MICTLSAEQSQRMHFFKMAFKKSGKAHVTFGDSKRIISYEKDQEVGGLRHRFLQVFSDMLSDDVAPANVRFQQYHDFYDDYVDLENGQKLKENARIKAITITSTKGKKGMSPVALRLNNKDDDDCSDDVDDNDDDDDDDDDDDNDDCNDDYDNDEDDDDDNNDDGYLTASYSSCKPEADPHCSHGQPCHVVIPWYLVKSDTDPTPVYPPDIKFHSIKKDVPYRWWNPVSNGLVQRQDDSNVFCKGSFSDTVKTVIQAKSVGNNLFHLVFNGDGPPNDYLYITSQGDLEGQQVIVTSSPTNDSVFFPDYYWGQTMFRSNECHSLYLGSDSDCKLVLVPMQDPLYPNPQALFVVNKYGPPA
ncbi:hypothetical protein ACROYT_G037261 [Oculina patagonica]